MVYIISSMAARAHLRPGWRRLIRAVAAVVIGILVALVWYQLSPQPGASIVKAVFEAGPEVKPPAGFAAIESRVTVHKTVTLRAADAPDAGLVLYTPDAPSSASLPVILWIHGGGFISSSTSTVADYAIMLADAGYVVASLDYSLAPAAKYPVPVRQGNAALAYLEAHASEYGGDASRIVLGGDSAGAQISSELAAVQTTPALASALSLQPAAPEGLRGVVLFCGLYDLDTVGSSGFPGLRTYLWSYTGQRDWQSFAQRDQLSTVKQVTSQYPPTFITVGDADPFRTQAAELIAALKAHGVTTDALLWTGSGQKLGHEYQFDFAKPAAQTAWTRTLAFLSTRTEK